jgi:Zn-dependent peptidase ImmA (M78 family)/transcriptional regulator with XRE-family HTH domain
VPRNGTPGFSGSRLREAREARGLTAVSLAELVGVTPQAVSQYEHDTASPSPDRAYLLAAKLNVPMEFLLATPRDAADRVVFYRSRAAATKAERIKAARRLAWLEDIVSYVDEQVVLPAANVPELRPVSARFVPTPPGAIEDLASELRRTWALGDGPAPNVVLLLESKGVVVTRGVIEAQTIDAFSSWSRQTPHPCVFLGADKDSAVRSRFDAAHELGHLMLHTGLGDEDLDASRRLKAVEEEAHAFARAFLLPASGFLRDLQAPTLGSMLTAKRKWLVSIGVMIFRCQDLELLKPWEAQRLWFARSRRGWQRQEPLDDVLEPESVDLLPRSVRFLIKSGAKTRRQVADDLRLSPSDIESLTGLTSGFLSAPDDPPAMMDRKSATVIPFPRH